MGIFPDQRKYIRLIASVRHWEVSVNGGSTVLMYMWA